MNDDGIVCLFSSLFDCRWNNGSVLQFMLNIGGIVCLFNKL